MRMGQKTVPNIGVLADHRVFVTLGRKSSISGPTIRLHQCAWFHAFFHGLGQTRRRRVWHTLETDTSKPTIGYFHGNEDQRLTSGSTASLAGLRAADVRLIYLYRSRKPVAPRAYHCTPQFMEPSPSGAVTAQTQVALQSDCANAVLPACHMPYCPEPHMERFVRVLKNGPGRYRSLIIAVPATVKASFGVPSLAGTASGTPKATRPAQFRQVLKAGFFRSEALFKL